MLGLITEVPMIKLIILNAVYWLVALAPGIPFMLVYRGYRKILLRKRTALIGVLSQKGVFASYQARFGQAEDGCQKTVDELFSLYYGPTAYILPISMNVVVVTIGVAIGMMRAGVHLVLPGDIAMLAAHAPLTLGLGFAGAYLLSLYDTLRRCRASDLSAYSLHFTWVHMVLASILAPLVCQAFTPAVAAPVAFGLGLFPIKDTVDFVRNAAKKKLEISVAPEAGKDIPLTLVEGMNKNVIDRLEEEGITSTVELAYYDPVKLLLKTNFQWAWVIDVMDQAILVNYVGEKITDLRAAGIRGAIEMSVVGEPEMNQQVTDVVSFVATRLNETKEEARNLGLSLYEDGQVDLIWQLFKPYESPGRQTKPANILGQVAA
jgi:hypothetical protein